MASQCKRCGAAVTWVVTDNDRLMPVNAHPDLTGTFTFTGRHVQHDERITPQVRYAAPSLMNDGHPRYLAHAATCPDAAGHVDPGQVGGAPARHDHPDTSHEAAATVRVGSQQSAVLFDLWERAAGATAYDLASDERSFIRQVRPGVSPNQVASRLGELRTKDLAEVLLDRATGLPVKRDAAAGQALVHVLTAEGRAEALRLRLL